MIWANMTRKSSYAESAGCECFTDESELGIAFPYQFMTGFRILLAAYVADEVDCVIQP
jgi:hypothetical protein